MFLAGHLPVFQSEMLTFCLSTRCAFVARHFPSIPTKYQPGRFLISIGDHVFISLGRKLRGQHINSCSQVIHNAKCASKTGLFWTRESSRRLAGFVAGPAIFLANHFLPPHPSGLPPYGRPTSHYSCFYFQNQFDKNKGL